MRIKKQMFAGVIAALAIFASGCGGSSGGSGTTGPTQGLSRLNTTPAARGAVNLVTWDLPIGEPYSLDPILAFDYSSSEVLVNLCDSLLIQAPSGAIVPDLAANVTHPDALTWVYTIRTGVRFWDGSPMTTSDVIFSLERNINPKDASFYLNPWGTFIKSIKQTGANQVTVTTTTPNVVVNDMMASGLGMVTEKRFTLRQGKAFGTPKGGVMCTGPFKLVRWTAGSDVLVARNPDYWNKALEPKATEVDFKFVTDPSTLTDALLAGSIDGTYEAPIAGLPRLLTSTTGRLYLGRNLQSLWMFIAHSGGPLGDPRVREALSMMIDRVGIAHTVFAGTARPQFAVLASGLSAADPGAYATAEAQARTTPDLSKAQALVKAAKPSKTPAVIVVTQGDTASIEAATTIQAAGTQLGLNMSIREIPGAQFGALLLSPKDRAPYAGMVGNSYLYTPLELLMSGWLPGASANLANYNDPQTTALITAAERATDVAQSSRLLAAAEARMMNWNLPGAGAVIPIADFAERLYMNNRVTGAPACFCYVTYPWAADLGAP